MIAFTTLRIDGRTFNLPLLPDGRTTCDCCDAAMGVEDAGEPLRTFGHVYCEPCFAEVIEAQA